MPVPPTFDLEAHYQDFEDAYEDPAFPTGVATSQTRATVAHRISFQVVNRGEGNSIAPAMLALNPDIVFVIYVVAFEAPDDNRVQQSFPGLTSSAYDALREEDYLHFEPPPYTKETRIYWSQYDDYFIDPRSPRWDALMTNSMRTQLSSRPWARGFKLDNLHNSWSNVASVLGTTSPDVYGIGGTKFTEQQYIQEQANAVGRWMDDIQADFPWCLFGGNMIGVKSNSNLFGLWWRLDYLWFEAFKGYSPQQPLSAAHLTNLVTQCRQYLASKPRSAIYGGILTKKTPPEYALSDPVEMAGFRFGLALLAMIMPRERYVQVGQAKLARLMVRCLRHAGTWMQNWLELDEYDVALGRPLSDPILIAPNYYRREFDTGTVYCDYRSSPNYDGAFVVTSAPPPGGTQQLTVNGPSSNWRTMTDNHIRLSRVTLAQTMTLTAIDIEVQTDQTTTASQSMRLAVYTYDAATDRFTMRHAITADRTFTGQTPQAVQRFTFAAPVTLLSGTWGIGPHTSGPSTGTTPVIRVAQNQNAPAKSTYYATDAFSDGTNATFNPSAPDSGSLIVMTLIGSIQTTNSKAVAIGAVLRRSPVVTAQIGAVLQRASTDRSVGIGAVLSPNYREKTALLGTRLGARGQQTAQIGGTLVTAAAARQEYGGNNMGGRAMTDNYARGSKFRPTANITPAAIEALITTSNLPGGTQSIRYAIYSHDAVNNRPGSPIGTTEGKAFSGNSPVSNQATVFAFTSSPGQLLSTVDYWAIANTSLVSGAVSDGFIQIAQGASQTGLTAVSQITYTGAWDDPFDPPTTTSTTPLLHTLIGPTPTVRRDVQVRIGGRLQATQSTTAAIGGRLAYQRDTTVQIGGRLAYQRQSSVAIGAKLTASVLRETTAQIGGVLGARRSTTASIGAKLARQQQRTAQIGGRLTAVRQTKAKIGAELTRNVADLPLIIGGVRLRTVRDSLQLSYGGGVQQVQRGPQERVTGQRAALVPTGLTVEVLPWLDTTADREALLSLLDLDGVLPLTLPGGMRLAVQRREHTRRGTAARHDLRASLSFTVRQDVVLADLPLRASFPGEHAYRRHQQHVYDYAGAGVGDDDAGASVQGNGAWAGGYLAEHLPPETAARGQVLLVADVQVGANTVAAVGLAANGSRSARPLLAAGLGVQFTSTAISIIGQDDAPALGVAKANSPATYRVIVVARPTGARVEVWSGTALLLRTTTLAYVPGETLGAVLSVRSGIATLRRWWVATG